jgi:hypothetical protein
MGVLWEIVQSGLMYGQHRKSNSIEDRVESVEAQLKATQDTLRSLVKKLEEIHKIDIDQDGKIG